MDSFSKCVFVRAGKHTSVHDVHPHSNLTIRYNMLLVPWLVTFLNQTEQGYLGGPAFGCTSPARAISRSSGSKSGPVVFDRLSVGSGWMS